MIVLLLRRALALRSPLRPALGAHSANGEVVQVRLKPELLHYRVAELLQVLRTQVEGPAATGALHVMVAATGVRQFEA